MTAFLGSATVENQVCFAAEHSGRSLNWSKNTCKKIAPQKILFNEVSRLLESDNQEMVDKFTEMHHWIRKDADQQAANAVLKLIE